MSHITLLRMTEWVDEITMSSNQRAVGLLEITVLDKYFSSSLGTTKVAWEPILLFKKMRRFLDCEPTKNKKLLLYLHAFSFKEFLII